MCATALQLMEIWVSLESYMVNRHLNANLHKWKKGNASFVYHILTPWRGNTFHINLASFAGYLIWYQHARWSRRKDFYEKKAPLQTYNQFRLHSGCFQERWNISILRNFDSTCNTYSTYPYLDQDKTSFQIMMTSSNGKNFPRYWPFVRGIHRPPVNSPH